MSLEFHPDRGAPVAVAARGGALRSFLERQLVSRWLFLLLGTALGILLALTVVDQAWYFSIVVVVAVPILVLIIRYPFAAVMLWLLFLPYFLSPPTVEQRTIYTVVHRCMIPAALGIALIARRFGSKERPRVHVVWAEWTMLAFLALSLVSILFWVQDPVRSGIQLYDLLAIPFCAYWLIRVTAPNEQDLKRLVGVALVTVIVQCAIALLSWFAPEIVPSQLMAASAGERTAGSLENPAIYTSTLTLMGLLLYHYAMTCTSGRLRSLLIMLFGLSIACVVFSFSRGSWLGSVPVLLGLLWIYPRVTLRLIIVLLIVGGLLGLSLLTSEVAWGYQRLTGEAAERSADSRILGDNALLSMVWAKPLTGWGYHSQKQHLEQFLVPIEGLSASPRPDMTSHNSYLTIAAELGVLALILYLFPTGWWLWASRRVRRRLPQRGFWSRDLLVVLWLAMLHMFVVNNFTDIVSFHLFGTTLWWIALALIASVVAQYVRPGPGDDANQISHSGQKRSGR